MKNFDFMTWLTYEGMVDPVDGSLLNPLDDDFAFQDPLNSFDNVWECYRKMLSVDPMIYKLTNTRFARQLALGVKWEGDDKYVEYLNSLSVIIKQIAKSAFWADAYGFISIEINYRNEGTALIPQSIFTPPNYWVRRDENFNLYAVDPTSHNASKKLHPDKVLGFFVSPCPERPYGKGFFEVLFWVEKFRRAGMQWAAAAVEAETKGQATYKTQNKSALDENIGRVEEFIESISRVLPIGIDEEVTPFTVGTANKTALLDWFISYCDKLMARVIAANEMAFASNDGMGSFALAKVGGSSFEADFTAATEWAETEVYQRLADLFLRLRFGVEAGTVKADVPNEPADDLEARASVDVSLAIIHGIEAFDPDYWINYYPERFTPESIAKAAAMDEVLDEEPIDVSVDDEQDESDEPEERVMSPFRDAFNRQDTQTQ